MLADLAMKQMFLVGVDEAAQMVGVRKPNFIRDYANKPDFPKPIADLACGRIWLRADIAGYLEDRDRGWLRI
jgi:predicted DNA-binding transcriptional regulator AlpA